MATSSPNDLPMSERELGDTVFLKGDTDYYLIMGTHSKGRDCQFLKCFSVDMAEMVTVQIQKLNEDRFLHEVAILEAVRDLDSKKHIVRLSDHFRFKDISCLVFEELDRSLFNLMCEREWMPLTFDEIRLVTHQLLVSVEAMDSIDIVHTDLKLENLMLVNHKEKPFKIKLINFGHAFQVSQVKYGNNTQKEYTAPESTLGLALSEAVDMWGVGCIMLYLYLGQNPHLYNCAYSWIKTIMDQQIDPGWPGDQALCSGVYSWRYFIFNKKTGWRLRTPKEYQEVTGLKPQFSMECSRNLEDALQGLPDNHEDLHRMAFLDLVKCCLRPDPKRRFDPSLALQHPFFRMVDMANILKTISNEEEETQKTEPSICNNVTTVNCEIQEDMEKTSIKKKNQAAEKKRKGVWERSLQHLGLRKLQIWKKPKDSAPNRPEDDSADEESASCSSSLGAAAAITPKDDSTDEESVSYELDNEISSDQQKTKQQKDEGKKKTKEREEEDKWKTKGKNEEGKEKTKEREEENKQKTKEREEDKQKAKETKVEWKMKTKESEEKDKQKKKEREEEDRQKAKEREEEDKQKAKEREEEDKQKAKEREEEDKKKTKLDEIKQEKKGRR